MNNQDYELYLNFISHESACYNLEQLACTLRSHNLALRHKAMEIILENFKSEAFEIFTQAINDPSWYVRNEAVWAMGQMGDKRAIPLLVKALSDSERKVYLSSSEVLSSFGWLPGNFEEKLRYYFARGNFLEIVKLGESGFELLLDSLKTVPISWDLACKAAHALGLLGDKRAVEPLIEALSFDNLKVSARIAEALGCLGDMRAFNPLINLLDKEDKDLQIKVIEALGKLGNYEASSYIISKLNDREPEIRITAVKALGELGDNIAAEPLINIIKNDKNSEIKVAAIRAMDRFNEPSIVTFLLELLNTASEELHDAVIESLCNIKDKRSVDVFLKYLSHSEAEKRFLSARALGRIGDKKALEYLIKALHDEDWCVCSEAVKALGRLNASEAVDAIKDFIFHKRSYIREFAVKALGNMGNSAVPYLETALKDKHNYVRYLAAASLEKLCWESEGPSKIDYYFAKRDYVKLLSYGYEGRNILLKGLRDNYSLIKDTVEHFILSLGHNGKDVILQGLEMEDPQIRVSSLKLLGELLYGEEIIVKYLEDQNSSVRRTAASVLRYFSPSEKILGGLRKSLEDTDNGVKSTAAKTLRKIGRINNKSDLNLCRINKVAQYSEPIKYMEKNDKEYSYEEMISPLEGNSERESSEGRDVMELCNKMGNDYYPENYVNIVLYEPKIPPNTGNIARLCAGTGAKLYLIGNLGFSLRDRLLRRAGLDYWHLLRMYYYETMDDLYRDNPDGRFYYFSSNVERPYTEVSYQKGDFLVFGPESPGLPASMIKKYEDYTVSIPMWGDARSFNLATCVGIAMYEALRQLSGGWKNITKF